MGLVDERREAKRIKKEQDAAEVAKLIKEIQRITAKMPQKWREWGVIETQQFKAFYRDEMMKKISLKRPKLEDIRRIYGEVNEWYAI